MALKDFPPPPELGRSADLDAQRAEIVAYVETLRAKELTFFQRRELRRYVDSWTKQLAVFAQDVEHHTPIIQLLNFAIRTIERLAEPAIEIQEGMPTIEKDSSTDFRMLVQSEFSNLPLEEVEPYDFSVFLLTESPNRPDPYRKLRIQSSLFQLPQVTSFWLDISKAEILSLMQRDEDGMRTALSVLATIKAWEKKQSQENGVPLCLKVDGVVCALKEADGSTQRQKN